MDESKLYWNTFMTSGRIADYLRYREALAAETARESAPEEPDAHQDRRDRHSREGDARA